LNLDHIITDLVFIKPELSISVTLVVLVLVDLIFSKHKKVLPFLAMVGLLITGLFIIEQFGMSSGSAFKTASGAGLITVDNFGTFFKTIILFASIIIIFFSMGSSEIGLVQDRHGEYYTLLFGMILGMFMMSSSADLIVLYLSIELLSLSSYILVGMLKTTIRNSEASLKYVIYGGVSSGIMLFGISIIFGISGSTNLYDINLLLHSQSLPVLTFLIAGLFVLVGLGFKISAAPFHFWTPDVYEGAPIPITAYLSVASKAAGFVVLIKFIKITFIDSVDAHGNWELFNIIDWKSIIILLSILTMTLGNFAALWQDNLKRMLAYSTIAHAGYMLLGLAVMSEEGIMAIMVYFIVYAFMNLGAFLVVMLVANKIGSEEIDDYKGLGKSMPFLGIMLAIFLVSLVGMPPTAGFIAKVLLFVALVDANMIALAVIALLNTVVSLYYYIRVLKNLYLVKIEKDKAGIPVSLANAILLIALVAPILIFGIYFTPIINFAKESAVFLTF
jgi:NADH-quinone oxidoreductase subunit N